MITKKHIELLEHIKYMINIDLTKNIRDMGKRNVVGIRNLEYDINNNIIRNLERFGKSSGRYEVQPNGGLGIALRLLK